MVFEMIVSPSAGLQQKLPGMKRLTIWYNVSIRRFVPIVSPKMKRWVWRRHLNAKGLVSDWKGLKIDLF